MFSATKIRWHKARTVGALQTYFSQPLREPLSPDANDRLLILSKRSLLDGATPIDTALRYYAEMAGRHIRNGGNLNDIGFAGVSGRTFALRDEMHFYREHHEALLALHAQQKDQEI